MSVLSCFAAITCIIIHLLQNEYYIEFNSSKHFFFFISVLFNLIKFARHSANSKKCTQDVNNLLKIPRYLNRDFKPLMT